MDYFSLSSNEMNNKKLNKPLSSSDNSLNNPEIMSIFLMSLRELQKEQKKKNNKKTLNKFSLRSGIMNKTFNKEEVRIKEITYNRSYDLTKRRKNKRENFINYTFDEEIDSKQSLESNKVDEEIDNENSLNNSFMYTECENKSTNSRNFSNNKLNSNTAKSKGVFSKKNENENSLEYDHSFVDPYCHDRSQIIEHENDNDLASTDNKYNKETYFLNSEKKVNNKRNFLIDNNKEKMTNENKIIIENQDVLILDINKNDNLEYEDDNYNQSIKKSRIKESKSLGSLVDEEARKFLINDIQKIVREIFKGSKLIANKLNRSPNEYINSMNSRNEEL